MSAPSLGLRLRHVLRQLGEDARLHETRRRAAVANFARLVAALPLRRRYDRQAAEIFLLRVKIERLSSEPLPTRAPRRPVLQ